MEVLIWRLISEKKSPLEESWRSNPECNKKVYSSKEIRLRFFFFFLTIFSNVNDDWKPICCEEKWS